jgi:hypothetical protein
MMYDSLHSNNNLDELNVTIWTTKRVYAYAKATVNYLFDPWGSLFSVSTYIKLHNVTSVQLVQLCDGDKNDQR